MERIFISYKRKDMEKVFSIVKRIEAELGIKCWVDLDGIESSEQFVTKICKAIDQSEVVLFMHSAAHQNIDFDNDWTVRELNYAEQKKKRVVLVKLDNTPLDNVFLMNYGSRNNIDSQQPVQMQKLTSDLRRWLKLPVKLDPVIAPKSAPKSEPKPAPKPASTKKPKRSWRKKVYDFFFDFSRIPLSSHVVGVLSLPILMLCLYIGGYYNSHPAGIGDFITAIFVSYIGMRFAVLVEAEDIHKEHDGCATLPFELLFVLLVPLPAIIIGGILGSIIDFHLHLADLHMTLLLYIYSVVIFFTIYIIITYIIHYKKLSKTKADIKR